MVQKICSSLCLTMNVISENKVQQYYMIPSRGHSEMKITETIIRVVGLDTVVHIFKSHYLGGREIVRERKVEWREEEETRGGGGTKKKKQVKHRGFLQQSNDTFTH